MEAALSMENREVKREREAMKIIVIDEGPLTSQIISEFIAELGYEVITFHSVSEFTQTNRKNPIPVDLILIDPDEAPRGQGHRIISKIHEQYPEADIVIMSTGNGVLDSKDAISQRVYSYLKKPVRLAELELLITRVSEKRGLHC